MSGPNRTSVNAAERLRLQALAGFLGDARNDVLAVIEEVERLRKEREEALKHHSTCPCSRSTGGHKHCSSCGDPWPCATATALGVSA